MPGWTRRAAFAGASFSIAVATALAGCGGSGGVETSSVEGVSTVDTNSSLSKSSYIERADGICAESNAAIAGLPQDTGGSSAAQELQIVRGEIGSLKALGQPSSDASGATSYIAALENVASALNKEKTAAASGNTLAVDSASSSVDSAKSRAQAAGRAFGFTDCARFGTPSGTGSVSSSGTGGSSPTSTAPTTTVAPTPTTATPTTPAPALPPTGGTPGTPTPPTGGTGGGGGGGTGGSGGTSPGGSGGVTP